MTIKADKISTRYIQNKRFKIKFSSDGKPLSIYLLQESKELLDIKDPGIGFCVRFKDGSFIPMVNIAFLEGEKLCASTSNGTQEVVFGIKSCKNYISFYLEHLKGFPTTSDLSLELNINVDSSIRVIEHNYMTYIENAPSRVEVKWPGLWQRMQGDSLGGFSLYHKYDDADEDDTIIRIWAEEGLVHPKVDGKWTYERAKGWVEEWQRKFPDRSIYDIFSVMALEAESLEELYKCAEYAKIAGVSGIYLMPWIWRGEYWPVKQPLDGINTMIFPRGEEDLKAYSDYLSLMGLHLELHNVSGGIGFQHPKYVKPKVDPRLSSWGSGKLAEDIAPDCTTIKFIPDKGVEVPYRIPNHLHSFVRNEIKPPALMGIHNFNVICINDELIQVGNFMSTDKEVWVFENCIRNFGNLKEEDKVKLIEPHDLTSYQKFELNIHKSGSKVVGLITTYEVNLLPDSRSTLFDEIAVSFAGLINRCNIAHVAYDGFEIHRFFGFGQDEKFAAKVYSEIDHPVIAHTSRGLPPKCHLVYRLNSTRKLLGSGRGVTADLRKHRDSWNASSVLEVQFALNLAAVVGTQAVGIKDHHCGVNLDILEGHGRSIEILNAVNKWKRLIPLLSGETRGKISSNEWLSSKLKLSGRSPIADEIYVLKENNSTQALYPTRVLTRKTGDIKWFIGQEHGVVAPKQYVKPGDVLELQNPYDTQELKFVIRVLYAHDYDNSNNINIDLDSELIENISDYKIENKNVVISISYNNYRNEEIWNENNLPNLKCNINMSSHRAIGMWVNGDSMEALLAIQIPNRDYIIPIDFKGEKYIEIPNGEVSWADSRWGWRMGTWKYIDYSKVNTISLGFGKIPPQTSCSIDVKGLKALKEIKTELKDPVIKIGNSEMRIKGSVLSEQYLEYMEGDCVIVYDSNWNKLKVLPVEKIDYTIKNGWNKIIVETQKKELQPWLEVQFITEGKPIGIV